MTAQESTLKALGRLVKFCLVIMIMIIIFDLEDCHYRMGQYSVVLPLLDNSIIEP